MTSAELLTVYNGCDMVGDNVFNFFFTKFKEYEPLFVTKKGKLTDPGNDLISREDLISWVNTYNPDKKEYYRKKELIKIYDDIKDRMTWKDFYLIIMTSGYAELSNERYDFKTLKEETENICSVVDRTTGDRIIFAADQVERMARYDYNEQCYVIDPTDGVAKLTDINKGVDRLNTDKHRSEINYRD